MTATLTSVSWVSVNVFARDHGVTVEHVKYLCLSKRIQYSHKRVGNNEILFINALDPRADAIRGSLPIPETPDDNDYPFDGANA